MTLLKRINSSLMNQVSHGTLTRIFDHEEAKAGRADAVPWGYYGGPGKVVTDFEAYNKADVG